MRELNECTAEVFRRSEKRIKKHRRIRNRVLAVCIPLCLVFTLLAVENKQSNPPVMMPAGSGMAGYAEEFPQGDISDSEELVLYGSELTGAPADFEELGDIDRFSFSLTWGCYGISSYDSKTGKLVKTTDATNPEDYVTTYWLTTEQKQTIYDLILNLNVTDYPDKYNPSTNGLISSPSMTLILSVKSDTVQKTITAADIAYTYKADNREGQRFLSVCKAIEDILTSTEEWKSLPEYEFIYD
ncbi:MAG: hypothetical protein K2G56_03545 [Eubacterium sp.]|nr:hypothetical protein [Eubacterium sp.]